MDDGRAPPLVVNTTGGTPIPSTTNTTCYTSGVSTTKRQVHIEDDLWRETKIAAAKDGFTATHIVNAALTQWLARFHDGPIRAALEPITIPLAASEVERRTAPLPAGASFGRSVPAPKPMKKGR